MKFGICGDAALAANDETADYDYLEANVQKCLVPTEPDASFNAALEKIKQSELPVTSANCLMPGNKLRITGDEVDKQALEGYIQITMKRAETAKISNIVFGSGGARRVPDGFDKARARDQILDFCRMMGPIAADHGVTIAVEPLNLNECNILNTVEECAEIVLAADNKAIRLLVDAYHHMMDNDSLESIVSYGHLICHTHIATVPNRLPPSVEACDFKPFFDSLNASDYCGGVSIEASGIADHLKSLPEALSLIKQLAEAKA